MNTAKELNRTEESEALNTGIYLHKPGKIHISVCSCLNCHLNRADKIITKLQKELGVGNNEWISRDRMISFDKKLKSIGVCGRGVMVKINNEYYFGMTEEKIAKITDRLRHEYGSVTISELLKNL